MSTRSIIILLAIFCCSAELCLSIDFSSTAVVPGDSLFFQSQIKGEVINTNNITAWEESFPVNNEPQCRSKCHLSTQCRSIIYHETESICKLRNINRLSPNAKFVEKPGVKSFDKRTAPLVPMPIMRVNGVNDCKDIFTKGLQQSGLYMIPSNNDEEYVLILCDMKIAGSYVLLTNYNEIQFSTHQRSHSHILTSSV